MKQKAKQPGGRNQMISQLTAEKKKIVIAAALIGIMAIMWVRVLAKKSESPAGTVPLATQTAAAEEMPAKIQITYVELPQIKGRNDMLTRDIFSGSKWEGLGAEANGAQRPKERIKSGNEKLSDTITEMIGKELKLEAILSGKNPQAYVGGMLVSPGGKLTVKHEGEKYEFKAVEMNDNEVVLECKGVQVKLSMTRPSDSAN
jgi:hypothetical protein